ncbi:MAG: DUF4386 domain-containing protein [Acidobacteriota bacterium]
MTDKTNARLAGFTFLFYIATGIASMVLSGQATKGAEGTAAKLASIAQHAPLVRLNIVLTLLTFVIAVVLAVALYALTRDQDRDLATMALCCRVTEGVIAAISTVRLLGVLSIATAAAGAAAADAAAANALAALLLKMGGWTGLIAATCFAVGSTLYSYLFLRARSIPVALAWLGVFASILLVVLLPAQLAGFLTGAVTNFMWLPMLVFEVWLALWLLIKGVRPSNSRPVLI